MEDDHRNLMVWVGACGGDNLHFEIRTPVDVRASD